MMSARWCRSSRSARTRSASGRSLAITASALLISSSVFTPRDRTLIRSTWAAAWTCFSASTWRGLAAFQSRAMYETLGTTSLSSSSRFASISVEIAVSPVMFPPGWLSDGTMPAPTGSPTAVMTTGTEVVAFLTARVAGVPAVTITATFRASSSPMRAGKRSYFPSAHRYSIRTLRPSTYPRSRNPSRKGSTRLASRAAVEFPRNPIRYTLPVCWAWAASDPSRMPRVMMKPSPLTVTSTSSSLSRSPPERLQCEEGVPVYPPDPPGTLLHMSLHRSNCAANVRLSGRRHHIRRSSRRSTAVRSSRLLCGRSLNHFIRTCQNRRRQRQAEGLGGLHVDDQLELRWLLDWQVAWLRSFENLVHVCGGVPVHRGEIRRVGDESAGRHVVPVMEHRG